MSRVVDSLSLAIHFLRERSAARLALGRRPEFLTRFEAVPSPAIDVTARRKSDYGSLSHSASCSRADAA
jgi:hypothetical protein